jgi:hypothetical protein
MRLFRSTTCLLSTIGVPTVLPRLSLLALALLPGLVIAQTPQLAVPPPASIPAAEPQPPQGTVLQPQGTVLFERHTDPDAAAPPQPSVQSPAQDPTVPEITDAERSALRITVYDLDARLVPAAAHLEMRALLTVTNAGAAPLAHVALQISSSLTWDSATLAGSGKLPLVQHMLDTDADHTGAARELILTLPAPLAPGASVQLDTFYSGTITADATRLTRIGASPAQAANTDWDAISSSATSPGRQDTALRGFGNVLWYPVAQPALFLGDGARLFQAIASARFRNQGTSIRLRLNVEYKGEPPVAAYFCGRRAKFTALADDPDAPTASGSGIASADFAAEPIGFRLPSLFLIDHAEERIAPLQAEAAPAASTAVAPGTVAAPNTAGVSSSSADAPALATPTTAAAPAGPPLLAVETDDDASLPRLAESAQGLAPLLQVWFGEQPLSSLTVLDHSGEPFEDGPLVVAPVASLAASTAAGALVHSMTHAWVQTGQPWMDEGLAQFIALLWTEQQQGRAVMVNQLTELLRPLALAEPAITESQVDAPAGQPIVSTPEEMYYRRKSAAVWLMLRGIVGDQPLAAALTAWRMQAPSQDEPAVQAVAFERLLEKISGKDLGWFFRDWVLHDRGLPDLSIVDIAPRTLPAGKGHDSGWLVAVTVRNDGAAECEVPIVIRSGTFSTTKRLRVPAFGNVTDRVLVEAAPTQVVVNDGITPEVASSIHTRAVVLDTSTP